MKSGRGGGGGGGQTCRSGIAEQGGEGGGGRGGCEGVELKILYQHNIKKRRIDPGANLRYLEGGVRPTTAVRWGGGGLDPRQRCGGGGGLDSRQRCGGGGG